MRTTLIERLSFALVCFSNTLIETLLFDDNKKT